MKIEKTGNWRAAFRLLEELPERLAEARDKALLQEGQFFRTKIVQGMRDQAPGGRPFQPLSPLTLALRELQRFRGRKALLRQGDLRNSITVTKEGDAVLVGVLRSAKGRDGRDLVNVAAVHEYGSRPIAIKLSAKARRFLHLAYRRAGIERPVEKNVVGIAIVRVPARPFLAPVFEQYGSDAEQVRRRFLGRMARIMSRRLGPFTASQGDGA